MVDVSILVPLFGGHRGRQTLPSVCAGWAGQDVSCEIVVAVAGDSTMAVPEMEPVRVVRAHPATASPGVLRNLAATRAMGSWFYLSDADVRPVGRDYLSRALDLAGTGALAQPWLFRLAGTDVPGGAEDEAWLRRLSERRCCFLRPRPSGHGLVPCPDERYVWDGDTLMVVPPGRADGPPAATELHWRAPFHWGGLLLRRGVFAAVGGYCTEYVGWGCEDDDLLAKVRSRSPVVLAWRADPSLRCLHYEHPRPYGTPAFAANQVRLATRLAAGAAAMVESDRRARNHG